MSRCIGGLRPFFASEPVPVLRGQVGFRTLLRHTGAPPPPERGRILDEAVPESSDDPKPG